MCMCTCMWICACMHHSMHVEVRGQLSFLWQSVFPSTTCILGIKLRSSSGLEVSNPFSGSSCCFCTRRSCSLILETTKVERDRGINFYFCLMCTYTDTHEHIHMSTHMNTYTWTHEHTWHTQEHTMNIYIYEQYIWIHTCIHTHGFYYKLYFQILLKDNYSYNFN